jgi:hypothetical protein
MWFVSVEAQGDRSLKSPICIMTCKREKHPNSKGEVCLNDDGRLEAINLRPFFICAVGLWVLRPLLAYCTSPG